MAVRKTGNTWWTDFRFNHERYRKRSPENSKTGALAFEANLRQKLARGESIDGKLCQTKEPMFSEFAQQWYAEYVQANNRQAEQRAKLYILNSSLIPFFGGMPISQIRSQHIEQYKGMTHREGASEKTINNKLAVLRKCIITAYEWLELESAPPKIVRLKAKPPTTDYLSTDEVGLLLSHARGIGFELILVALRTGMRQGELRGLQWSSVDWENESITVRHAICDCTNELTTTKSNRERHIPISTTVYDMLRSRKKATGYVFGDEQGEPYSDYRLNRRLAKTCEQAGLRKIGWHTLRHTFASHLVAKGAPINVVQQLMGHSTVNMTMRYVHLAPSMLRGAISLLDPKMPNSPDFGQPVVNEDGIPKIVLREQNWSSSKNGLLSG